MTPEEWAIIEELKQKVPIVECIEHDCDVRKRYMDASLTLLSILRANQIDEELYKNVKSIRDKIMEILKNYLCGNIITASSQMQNLLKRKIEGRKLMEYAIRSREPSLLYRGRVSTLPLIHEKEFYHIPFTTRYRIGNQRYSLSGIPCLYLASSEACVLSELDVSSTSSLYLCTFQPKEIMDYFDLSEGYDQCEKEESSFREFLYTLPLKLACSMMVIDNEKETFKTNYVIPQLITACLYNMMHPKTKRKGNSPIDAICFSSIKGCHLTYEDRLNYVFLPNSSYKPDYEYDETLINKFMITVVPHTEH